jgi:hypothetical protein
VASVTPVRMVKEDDYVPGDPARYVLGRLEEQPARVHLPLPRKPRVVNAATIAYDLQLRMDQLRPAVEEVARLERALEALEGI